jgi:hypothetical protein
MNKIFSKISNMGLTKVDDNSCNEHKKKLAALIPNVCNRFNS